MTHYKNLVKKSLEVANSKTKLKKRLMEAKAVLNDEAKKKFKTTTFDFQNKRLIGDGYSLQWKLRHRPEEPESYENQQTSVGTVVIEKL